MKEKKNRKKVNQKKLNQKKLNQKKLNQKKLNQKKLNQKQKYSVLSNIWYFYRYAYREIPKLAIYQAVIVAGGCICPFLGILMPGIVLSAVQAGNLGRGLTAVSAAGLVMLAGSALTRWASEKNYFYVNLLRSFLLGEAVLKEIRCLYRYVEYDEQAKVTKRAYQSMSGGDGTVSRRMLEYPRELAVHGICFLLYSTVLGTLKPWLVGALLLLSLADYWILQRKNRWQLALREELAQSDREISYLNRVFRDTGMAKDVRIFAMNGWLMALRQKIFGRRMRLERRNSRREILADFLQLSLGLLRDGAAYVYLIRACLRGEISPAGFLVYFGAIAGFSGFVTGIAGTCARLRLASEEASFLRAHMELPEVEELGAERGGGPEPAEEVRSALYRQPAGIEFRDVSFSYGERKLYDHFNLRIRPGEKVALLGMNGAGKTTLVKLLCGLYEPDEGKILINGVDISVLPKRVLYSLFSVVFQEAAILPYPVGCNISFRKPEETDRERAWEALREAGLEAVFRERGIGLDSFMTKRDFQDGVELSGGETQRLLLARAIYRNGNIWILDEPTSALDPIAESEVYEEYGKLIRGRTALFISHRLASTRFSDRILFLEEGRIKEEGTHEELMALGGSYAHMFEVQSHYYVYEKTEERTEAGFRVQKGKGAEGGAE